jgi:membrane-associated protease RseP (regulator of RpoE activity)
MTYPFPFVQNTSHSTDIDDFTPYVSKHLRIDEVTWGGEKQEFLVRYRGRLYADSVKAYEKLASALRPLDVTPIFRKEAGSHYVILVPGVIRPRPSNPWINLILFIATLISVISIGTLFSYDGPPFTDWAEVMPHLTRAIGRGMAFAASLLGILLAHEFGHYLAARYHKTAVTLPYFIPFPTYFGTMGAFIQLKEPPRNKRILLDIGIAGPLAGLVVAIPVLLLGLSLSEVTRLPVNQAVNLEGNSILYLLAKYLVHGQWLPEPVHYAGMHPGLYWIRYLFTGLPVPHGGMDVILHPVAFAGWAGLLVTALNLIPAGQLDGGHVLYVLMGRKARMVLPFILFGLVILGTVWPGWWLWAFIIFLMGRVYAEPLDQITPLDPKRRFVAIIGLIVFILVFTPVPLRLIGV